MALFSRWLNVIDPLVPPLDFFFGEASGDSSLLIFRLFAEEEFILDALSAVSTGFENHELTTYHLIKVNREWHPIKKHCCVGTKRMASVGGKSCIER
jgi:hypothetical protein